MKYPHKMHSFTVWKGPSVMDGKPIALLVTRGKKANKKTGSMIQTYIIRRDMSPVEILQKGLDGSICGDCIHSSAGNGGQGTCYVRTEAGVSAVFQAYKRGKYPLISSHESNAQVAGERVRIGTYGDPYAVPERVWSEFLTMTLASTGYTHAWKSDNAQWLKRYCMASCDTEAEHIRALADGWRTFYVLPTGSTVKPVGSFLCPASSEAGRKLTCSMCLACDGTKTERKASVYIPVHGAAFKPRRFTANLIQIGRN